jgi:hypothetical protein
MTERASSLATWDLRQQRGRRASRRAPRRPASHYRGDPDEDRGFFLLFYFFLDFQFCCSKSLCKNFFRKVFIFVDKCFKKSVQNFFQTFLFPEVSRDNVYENRKKCLPKILFPKFSSKDLPKYFQSLPENFCFQKFFERVCQDFQHFSEKCLPKYLLPII